MLKTYFILFFTQLWCNWFIEAEITEKSSFMFQHHCVRSALYVCLCLLCLWWNVAVSPSEIQLSFLFSSTQGTRELPEVLRASQLSCCEAFCTSAHCRLQASHLRLFSVSALRSFAYHHGSRAGLSSAPTLWCLRAEVGWWDVWLNVTGWGCVWWDQPSAHSYRMQERSFGCVLFIQ